ncbi:MAG: class I SAM-dependent methyltransferase [Marinobacter sp.]|nr:class I SAM-dependent methyltransferase [Marinobacter sp.]
MHRDKPFSQACENNKRPILEQLARLFTLPGTILEIGSGTGQHVAYFAAELPHLTWQPSERPTMTHLCLPWIQEAKLNNLNPPIPLDVSQPQWPPLDVNGIFSANTAHIMAWPDVEKMFWGASQYLAANALFVLYGPFNYQGRYTSESNAQFDRQLRAQAGHMGIRDMDDLLPLARQAGMTLAEDITMPANNRLLVWRKLATA